MAGAVLAVAGAAAGSWVSGIVGGGIFGAMLGAVVSFGVQALGSQILGLGPQEIGGAQPISMRQRGILANVASTVAPIPVVYGQARIGGTVCFLEVSGTENEYLHIVIALCEGEVDSINEIFLDDQDSTVAKFSGLVTVYKHVGTEAQTVDATLKANFPTAIDDNFKLSGVAYIYVILQYDPDVFNSIPTITANVKGRKVYNPSTGLTAWSENPALCTRDYLTNDLYGCALPSSLIDDDNVISSADYCDELVNLIGGGGTQKRYTCNGVLLTSQSRITNLKQLQSCYAGMLIFSAGMYVIKVDRPATYSYDFNIDNIIGEWSISLGDKNNKYNTVSAEYIDPDNNSQPNIAFDTDSSIRALDNNLVLKHDISLPYVNDYNRALRIAHMDLWRSRFSIHVEFTATFSALDMVAGDVCSITHITPMWYGKLFVVTKLKLNPDGTVRVSAKEYNSIIYEPPATGSKGTALYTLSDLNKQLVKSVSSNKLVDAAVASAKLADGSVVAAKVSSGAIGTDKIADSAVATSHVQSGAITTPHVSSGAIGQTQVADSAIATSKLVDLNVTTGKVANNAISGLAFGFTAGAISVSNVSDTLVVQCSITATGKNILINYSAQSNDLDAIDYYRLYRGGTLLMSAGAGSNPLGSILAGAYVDAPSAGTYTYYLYIRARGFSKNFYNRFISSTELKK